VNMRWIEGLLVSTLSLGMISVCLVSLGGCPSTPTPRCSPGCDPGLVCDRGYCIPGMAPPPDAFLPDAATPCAAPRLVCEARCIDPRTDVDHCGRCGERCRSSMDTCIAGICTRDDDD